MCRQRLSAFVAKSLPAAALALSAAAGFPSRAFPVPTVPAIELEITTDQEFHYSVAVTGPRPRLHNG